MSRLFNFLCIAAVALTGCDASIESFPRNDVYALTLARSRSVATDSAAADASAVTEQLFGTPNEPKVPEGLADLLDIDRLTRSAGPVSSEIDGTHLGLYQEHCVTCHGIDGGGAGPASLYQKPHPRNFRHGVFKWKSTQRAAKPTRDDLRSILVHGAPGSPMPSFAAVDDDDLDALVDYVIYLSMRGETERRLMAAAIDELDYGDAAVAEELKLAAETSTEGGEVVAETVSRVAGDWRAAGSEVIEVPAIAELDASELDGSEVAASVGRGKELFHGQIANCVGCHGVGGAGQGGDGPTLLVDYDDWGKEYSTRLGLTPDDRDDMRPFRKAGALPPRKAEPRNLTLGVYRGGGDEATLYRRITQGIAGSPMPGIEVVAEENGRGLTSAQVWDLVRYLQSITQRDAS